MPDVNFTENFNRKLKEEWDRESEGEPRYDRKRSRKRGRTYTENDYDYDDSMIWDNFGDW